VDLCAFRETQTGVPSLAPELAFIATDGAPLVDHPGNSLAFLRVTPDLFSRVVDRYHKFFCRRVAEDSCHRRIGEYKPAFRRRPEMPSTASANNPRYSCSAICRASSALFLSVMSSLTPIKCVIAPVASLMGDMETDSQ